MKFNEEHIKWLWLESSDLLSELEYHRYNWVVNFITETAEEILNTIDLVIFTDYDKMCLKMFSCKQHKEYLKRLPHNSPNWQTILSGELYAFFKVCRKLSMEDKITIGYNFEQTRLQ